MKNNLLKKFAKTLKNNQTNAENYLWYYLRNRQMQNLKFRRQVMLLGYIADFVCFEKKLIIELDGGQHVNQLTYDMNRTRMLNTAGFQVIRFWNHEVLQQIDVVLEKIRLSLNNGY